MQKHQTKQYDGLALPNFNEPFNLYADASGFGIGVVLTQNKKSGEVVVAWISRKLKPA